MADNKVNSGLLEFSEDQKVFIALDADTSEVQKAVTIDGDGVETDLLGVQPSGKKEITSTAEVDVASYATAQVVDEDLVAGNIKKDVDILGVVGSYEPAAPASDFSTADVTFVNIDQTTQPYKASATAIKDNMIKIDGGNVLLPVTITVPLYKGKNLLPVTCILQTDESTMPTTEGDIEFSIESMGFLVTGDGTIKAKGLISA